MIAWCKVTDCPLVWAQPGEKVKEYQHGEHPRQLSFMRHVIGMGPLGETPSQFSRSTWTLRQQCSRDPLGETPSQFSRSTWMLRQTMRGKPPPWVSQGRTALPHRGPQGAQGGHHSRVVVPKARTKDIPHSRIVVPKARAWYPKDHNATISLIDLLEHGRVTSMTHVFLRPLMQDPPCNGCPDGSLPERRHSEQRGNE